MQLSSKHLWAVPVLLGLGTKACFLSSSISSTVKTESAEVAGISEDRVRVDGLNVTLVGFADEASAEKAIADVKQDVSWVRDVRAEGFDSAAAGPTKTDAGAAPVLTKENNVRPTASQTVETQPASPASQATKPKTGSLTMELQSDKSSGALASVVVEGQVRDETGRTSLLETVREGFGEKVKLVDKLTIGGEADLDSSKLVVTGSLNEETASSAKATLGSVAQASGVILDDRTEIVKDTENSEERTDPPAGSETGLLPPIEFDFSSSSVRNVATAELDEAAAAIASNPQWTTVQVIGHTDTDGSVSSNRRLSLARAWEVVTYLVEEKNIDRDRLEAVGLGESTPVVSPEKSKEDKQRNRRIEWKVVAEESSKNGKGS